MQRSGVQALLCASYFAGTLVNIDNFTKSNRARTGLPCGMVWIRAEWCGSVRNDADLCGLVRIRVDWCGSVRTGVESVLVRAEHQGEGKLLESSYWDTFYPFAKITLLSRSFSVFS